MVGKLRSPIKYPIRNLDWLAFGFALLVERVNGNQSKPHEKLLNRPRGFAAGSGLLGLGILAARDPRDFGGGVK